MKKDTRKNYKRKEDKTNFGDFLSTIYLSLILDGWRVFVIIALIPLLIRPAGKTLFLFESALLSSLLIIFINGLILFKLRNKALIFIQLILSCLLIAFLDIMMETKTDNPFIFFALNFPIVVFGFSILIGYPLCLIKEDSENEEDLLIDDSLRYKVKNDMQTSKQDVPEKEIAPEEESESDSHYDKFPYRLSLVTSRYGWIISIIIGILPLFINMSGMSVLFLEIFNLTFLINIFIDRLIFMKPRKDWLVCLYCLFAPFGLLLIIIIFSQYEINKFIYIPIFILLLLNYMLKVMYLSLDHIVMPFDNTYRFSKSNLEKHGFQPLRENKTFKALIEFDYISKDRISLKEELNELEKICMDSEEMIRRGKTIYSILPELESLLSTLDNTRLTDDEKTKVKEILDRYLILLKKGNRKHISTQINELVDFHESLLNKLEPEDDEIF